MAVDYAFFRKIAIVPWNIVAYNIFGGQGRGPEIFGIEPWTFYVRNLLLNFNVWFGLALLSGPLLLIQAIFNLTLTSPLLRSRLNYLAAYDYQLQIFVNWITTINVTGVTDKNKFLDENFQPLYDQMKAYPQQFSQGLTVPFSSADSSRFVLALNISLAPHWDRLPQLTFGPNIHPIFSLNGFSDGMANWFSLLQTMNRLWMDELYKWMPLNQTTYANPAKTIRRRLQARVPVRA